MDVHLKITVREIRKESLNNVLQMVEGIKADHPDLFQQIKVAVKC